MKPAAFHSYSHLIDGLIVVDFDVYKDERGDNYESFNSSTFKKCAALKDITWNVMSHSRSKHKVCRAFHGDSKNHKAIMATSGEIFAAIIDPRPNSPTYGNHVEFVLSENNPRMIIMEPGILNGHCCLSENCSFLYLLSHGYVSQDKQLTEKWNSPKFSVQWPFQDMILSKRDR